MKRLKHIITLLVFGCLILINPSCQDFLEVESPSSFDKNYIFSSKDDALRSIMGAYATFGEDSYGSRFSTMFMQNTDVEATKPNAQGGSMERRDVWSLEASKYLHNSEFIGRWELAYKGIDRANQCIEGLLESDLKDTPDYKQMLGEVYCIRAYWYYLLTNFWGDVPYFDKAVNADMELDLPRTDKNYIYTASIQDLINNEEGMMLASQGNIGITRMNREFVLGFIARLAMFRAGYGMVYDGTMKRADDYLNVQSDEKLAISYTDINGSQKIARTSTEYYELAANYCKKLISLSDRPLDTDFQQIFKNQCENKSPVGGDVLFEMGYLPNFSSAIAFAIGVSYKSEPKGDKWNIPPYESKNGGTTLYCRLNSAFFFTFDDDDIRRDVTFGLVEYRNDVPTNVLGFGSELPVGKWNKLWVNPPLGPAASRNTGVNWPLMRYSDVLLMLAEAENEVNGGPTGAAIDALKKVRMRAFPSEKHADKVHAYVAEKNSKDAFFNAIVDERAWEFGGECIRKFDLIRWNLYGKKIVEAKAFISYLGKQAYGLEPSQGLATNIYYNLSANGEINFLNKKYEIDPALLSGKKEVSDYQLIPGDNTIYARTNGIKSFWKYSDTQSEICDFGAWSWRGYKDDSGIGAVPYLFSIPERIVSESKYLRNEGYCF